MKLSFEREAIEAIAEQTVKRKTGARGLRSIMEGIMMDTMYEIPSDDSITNCMITKEVVEGNRYACDRQQRDKSAGVSPESERVPFAGLFRA